MNIDWSNKVYTSLRQQKDLRVSIHSRLTGQAQLAFHAAIPGKRYEAEDMTKLFFSHYRAL